MVQKVQRGKIGEIYRKGTATPRKAERKPFGGRLQQICIK